ncbi:MAG: hypothetical protein EXS13_04665 [Planctomycetes bacterium]|nr:hypothetical protein [Planctomycetota bacterium]
MSEWRPARRAAVGTMLALLAACERPQLVPTSPIEGGAAHGALDDAPDPTPMAHPTAEVATEMPSDPDAPDPRARVKPVFRGGKPPDPGEEAVKPEARWLQCEQHDIEVRGKNLRSLRIGKPGWPEVLLLHGARFDCRTWLELGTLELLAHNGFRAVAIDLPGYGKSKELPAKSEEFLWSALPLLDLKKPIVIFPSMSGSFAFPLVLAHPDAITALVPIAPVGVADFGPRLTGCELPTLIVWGEADTVIPIAQAETLHLLLRKSEKLLIPKAGHPCYQDDPKTFHDGLLRFLAPFKPTGPQPGGVRPAQR